MSGSKGGFSVVITAQDNASSRIAAINKQLAAARAPTERLGKEFSKLAVNTGLRDITRTAKDLRENFGKIAGSFGRIAPLAGALTGAGGVAGVIGAARSWADYGTNVTLAGQQAGVHASSIQTLGNATEIAGGQASAAGDAYVNLHRNVQLAHAGLGDPGFRAAMSGLGIGNFATADPTKLMDEVLSRLAAMKNLTQQTTYGNAILGGSFTQLQPVIQGGTAAYEQYLKTGQQVGVMTEAQFQQAVQLRKQMTTLGLSIAGVGQQVMSDLFPSINSASGGMAGWIDNNRTWLAQDIAGRIKTITDDANAAAKAFGGWNNALTIWAGFKLLSKLPGSSVTVPVAAAAAGTYAATNALQSYYDRAYSALGLGKDQGDAEGSALAGGTAGPGYTPQPDDNDRLGPLGRLLWGKTGRKPLASDVSNFLSDAASKSGLSASYMRSLATEEGGGYDSESSAGAIGPMQLMPGTASDMGVGNINNWKQNVNGGVKYFRRLLDKYGNYDQAAAAYNWGPGNVDKDIAANGSGWFARLPKVTQGYVTDIDAMDTAQNMPGLTSAPRSASGAGGQVEVHVKISGAPPGTRVSATTAGAGIKGPAKITMPMPAGGHE